jgi:hypothetical protein
MQGLNAVEQGVQLHRSGISLVHDVALMGHDSK